MTLVNSKSHTLDLNATGGVNFEALGEYSTVLTDLTLEDWLTNAQQDYTMRRIAALLCSTSDSELEAKLKSNPDIVSWFEFLDGIEPWRQRCRTLIEICDGAEARVMVVVLRDP